ncbi:hypothetical protein KSS87_007228 [Heliosperma pusillum]|nr:hypothetical protein KSS87_007228 [Heliosperma pusillum]
MSFSLIKVIFSSLFKLWRSLLFIRISPLVNGLEDLGFLHELHFLGPIDYFELDFSLGPIDHFFAFGPK